MRTTASQSALLLAVVAAALTLLPGARAHAAPTKVWVANAGADTSTCGSVSSPCRTFRQAILNVAAGGEIGTLTAGDYGAVSVDRSVHITNDGTGEASILPLSGGVGVGVGTGVGDIVSLRGLVIDGQGAGTAGITIEQASAVHVQNCVIRNFEGPGSGYGISWLPFRSGQLFVSDTIIFNNGSGADTGGIRVSFLEPLTTNAPPVNLNLVLERVHLENNVVGLKADGSTTSAIGALRVTVRDSVVSGNASNGIWSLRSASGGPSTVVLVDRTAVLNNTGAGVLADGNGVLQLSNSTVEYNGTGASVAGGGRLFSYQNNVIDNNVGEDLSAAAIARILK